MELATYKLGMSSEKKHRNVRLPADQIDLVKKVAEWRYNAGIDDQVNWTAALSFIIRFFEVVGGADKPGDAMNRVMDAAKARKKG